MMMKIKLIYFLLFNFFIHHSYAQSFTCNSIEGYNTLDLTRAVQWQVTPDYQCLANAAADCTFYISFCQTAPMCFNQYSACEKTSVSPNITIIGGFTTNVFHENASGAKGFYAEFPAGPTQKISNATTCAPSLRIKFNCNLKAKWLSPITNATAIAPEPTDIDFDANNPCLTIMTFDYSGACYPEKEPEIDGLSGGAIFLIILFTIAFVYFIGGIGYNACIRKQTGIYLLPHPQFWIGLPLNIIEGCRFIIGICTHRSTPSRASYDSV